MAFIRKIKKGNSVYLAVVENYRHDGKVKQRVIRYIGKEENGKAVKRVSAESIEIDAVKQYLDYKVLHEIAQKLGLMNILGDKSKYILLLVYTQLITRKPIYKLPDYIEHTALKELLGLDKIIDKQLFEALDELEDLNFNFIETKLFENLSKQREEKNALVLDVTDTYFNGCDADWKSRKGKDGKYDKLIQIALAVTKEEGFPILHRLYEGNINNTKIFQDLIAESRLKKFDIIILDSGMSSYESLKDLKYLNQQVIIGLRMNKKIEKVFLNEIEREEIYQPQHMVKLKNTQVYVKEFDFMEGKLIAIYNPELEITKREYAMLNLESYNSHKAKFMGYSLIYHTTKYSVDDIVKTYFQKDIVEKAYRELKSTINLHPIRKYRMSHIKAHVKICYMAYAILSYIQYKLKKTEISAVYALEQLQPVYKVDLKSDKENFKWSKIVTLNNLQKRILKLLECSV
jgi:transposase